jgi:MFS family permease
VAKVAGRFGVTRLLIAGLVTELAGMVWVSRLSAGTAYFPGIAIPMILLGAGLGIAIVTLTTRGIAGVAPEDSGAASGLLNVAQQVGASLGLGVLTAVFAAAGTHASSHPAPGLDAKREAAQVLAHSVSAALTGAAVFLGVALIVSLVMGGRRRTEPAVADPTEGVLQELDTAPTEASHCLDDKRVAIDDRVVAALDAPLWSSQAHDPTTPSERGNDQ